MDWINVSQNSVSLSQYIRENHGLDTEKSYPYLPFPDTPEKANNFESECRFKPSTVGATDAGFMEIPEGNEARMINTNDFCVLFFINLFGIFQDALAAAVAAYGPISVGIDASHDSFQLYSHGIYEEENCSSKV